MDNKTNINLYYVFLIHSNLYSQTPKFQSQEIISHLPLAFLDENSGND